MACWLAWNSGWVEGGGTGGDRKQRPTLRGEMNPRRNSRYLIHIIMKPLPPGRRGEATDFSLVTKLRGAGGGGGVEPYHLQDVG